MRKKENLLSQFKKSEKISKIIPLSGCLTSILLCIAGFYFAFQKESWLWLLIGVIVIEVYFDSIVDFNK